MKIPYMDIQAEYKETRYRRVLDLRPDGLDEVPMLGWYHYAEARPDLPVHRHAGGFEICYLERGRQVFEVNGQQSTLSGGDIFFTLPDEPHSTDGNPSEPGILFWINVRLPESPLGLFGLQQDESNALINSLLHLPHRHFRATAQTKALFEELFALHDRAEVSQRTTRMRCTAVRLLFEIIDGGLQHNTATTSQCMRNVIQWIHNHPGEEYSLKDLARRADLSISHFKKRFKTETGLSPWQFILLHRIEVARERLLTSDVPVTQLAHSLGFNSSQYFATVFKRMTGETPSECRKGTHARKPSKRLDDGQ